MGLFDAPAPLFAWLDSQLLQQLPPLARLMLWGIIGGALCMMLYRTISPQQRIASGKREQHEARQRLDSHDGDLADAWPLIRRLVGASLEQLGRVTGPTVIASLPMLALLVWLSGAYGYGYPSTGVAPPLRVSPPELRAEWIAAAPATEIPQIVITDGRRQVVAQVPLAAPVPRLHKWQWWNLLLGNPAGYLPSDAPVDRVAVSLPKKKYLAFGPSWVGGWELTFFISVLSASMLFKVLARIE